MDPKTLHKLAAIVEILKVAKKVGFIIVGGAKSVASFLGHDLSIEQQNAIELAIQIDATTRRDERRQMTGDDE